MRRTGTDQRTEHNCSPPRAYPPPSFFAGPIMIYIFGFSRTNLAFPLFLSERVSRGVLQSPFQPRSRFCVSLQIVCSNIQAIGRMSVFRGRPFFRVMELALDANLRSPSEALSPSPAPAITVLPASGLPHLFFPLSQAPCTSASSTFKHLSSFPDGRLRGRFSAVIFSSVIVRTASDISSLVSPTDCFLPHQLFVAIALSCPFVDPLPAADAIDRRSEFPPVFGPPLSVLRKSSVMLGNIAPRPTPASSLDSFFKEH